jgi:hypothetical protein
LVNVAGRPFTVTALAVRARSRLNRVRYWVVVALTVVRPTRRSVAGV